jgi:MFS family permease
LTAGVQGLEVLRDRRLQTVYAVSMAATMGTSLAYPVLPVLAQSLNVGVEQMGLVLTAFTLPQVFLSPIVGVIADLRGRRVLLAAGLFLYGLGGIGISLVDSFAGVLALRALQGVGQSVMMPLTLVLIGDLFTQLRETSAQGLKVSLDRAMLLVAPALAGALAALAWQLPFLLYGLTIPLGLAVLAWVPEPAAASERRHPRHYLGDVFAAVARTRSLVIFSISSLRWFLELAFFTYLPLLALQAAGVPTAQSGLLFTLFAIGAIVTSASIRSLVSRFAGLPLVVAAFAVQASCLLLASLAGSFWELGAVMVAWGLANGVISTVHKSLLTQSVPTSLRGGFVAADRVLQNIAKSAAPLVAGGLSVLVGIAPTFRLMAIVAFAWCLVIGLLWSGGVLAAPRPIETVGSAADGGT